MNRRILTGSIVLLLLGMAVLTGGLALAADSPLAEAGLDQNVTRGATVQLDATGSTYADGSIDGYDWTIETPDGETIAPDCSTCSRTSFEPSSVGTYAVTVSVTGDDGSTDTDTMFVTVRPGDGPDVTLNDPDPATIGEEREFSATIDSGIAPLSHAVWKIDGTVVANSSLDERADSTTLTRSFPTSGTRTVTVQVYDDDDRLDDDSISHEVHEAGGAPDPGGPEDPGEPTLAEQHTPHIDGPSLVTGSEPLEATYGVASAPSGDISTVQWYTDGSEAGTSLDRSIRWDPGDHTLSAVVTYTDGSRERIGFADGTHDVIADPEPEVTIEQLHVFEELRGQALAIDRYGNLDDVQVYVDGDEISHGDTTLDPGTPSDTRRLIEFDVDDIETGDEYEVSVVATDARGQTGTASETVTVVDTPEIVSSEFVNTPVDSYDHRIEADRYAAEHVLEIDLNGVDAGKVSVDAIPRNPDAVSSVDQEPYVQEREVDGNRLLVYSFWRGDSPGTYELGIESSMELQTGESHVIGYGHTEFEVTPSPPEIRIDILDEGTPHDDRTNWGLVVDAGDSFDPDGTDLDYFWDHSATPTTETNETAKFDSVDRAGLRVEDEYEQTAEMEGDFLHHYAPPIHELNEVSEGPYKPNETIRFEIRTEPYRLSKNSYHDNVDAQVQTGDGTVTSWSRADPDPDEWDEIPPHELNEMKQFGGTVEIPASEFVGFGSNPTIEYVNQNAPDSTRTVHRVPETEVYEPLGTVRTNVTIEELSYIVERPEYAWVNTDSEQERDDRIDSGYELADTETENEYTIEEYVKVQDAEYETKRHTFGSQRVRNDFVRNNDDWYADGSYTEEVTNTYTETEWRSSRSGSGTYTGNTRSVKVQSAEYQTERQYRSSLSGGTYWAPSKMFPEDSFTGSTRETKVQDAVYRTEYEYEYEVTETETRWYYRAATEEKVQEERYEWKDQLTTRDFEFAEYLVETDSDIRIGNTEPVEIYQLRTQTGTRTTTVDSYENPDEVLRTEALASGTIEERYFDPVSGAETHEVVGSFEEWYEYDDAKYTYWIREDISGYEDDGQCGSGEIGVPTDPIC